MHQADSDHGAIVAGPTSPTEVTSLNGNIPKGSARAIDLVLGSIILGILAAVAVTAAILVMIKFLPG